MFDHRVCFDNITCSNINYARELPIYDENCNLLTTKYVIISGNSILSLDEFENNIAAISFSQCNFENIPSVMEIVGLFTTNLKNNMLYISCIPRTLLISPNDRCYIYSYKVNYEVVTLNNRNIKLLTLLPIQDFRIRYLPLDIISYNYESNNYLIVLGSDKKYHIYQINNCTLIIHRNFHRDNIYNTLLSYMNPNFNEIQNGLTNDTPISSSILLKLVISQSNSSIQIATGYADGIVSISRIPNNINNNNNDIKKAFIPSLNKKLLKNKPIFKPVLPSIAFDLDVSSHDNNNNNNSNINFCTNIINSMLDISYNTITVNLNFQDIYNQLYKHCSPCRKSYLLDGAISCLEFYNNDKLINAHRHDNYEYIIVGLTDGACILLSLDNIKDIPLLLPGSYEHDSVQTICIADISFYGGDIFIGYNDGTIILCSRKLEGKLLLNLNFSISWSIQLKYPVMHISYRNLFNHLIISTTKQIYIMD
jgi:hypothetical protein